jgi:hypothetical protein
MSRRGVAAVVAMAGFALMAASRAHAASPADIQKLQEGWRTAIVAADLGALDKMYADDLVYVHSDARIQTKQEFLAPFKSGALRFAALTPCDTPRVRATDVGGIVSACYELKVGTGMPQRHLFLTNWAMVGGAWHIVAQQTTKIPEK